MELRGRVRGPVSGVGEDADLLVVVRGDGAVWAEVRRVPEGGFPVHEVLVWAPELALLFDRRTLKSTELGDVAGDLEAWGGHFVSADALWLLAGLRAERPDDPTVWERRSGQWRGRRTGTAAGHSDGLGLRRPVADPMGWTETLWRDAEGTVHRLWAEAEAHVTLPNGMRWPSRLGLEGTDLPARVVVQWDEVRWHPALGDSILDPLWEPPQP